jgi:hypothetical protein
MALYRAAGEVFAGMIRYNEECGGNWGVNVGFFMTYDPIPYAHAARLPPEIENNRRGALIGFGVGSLIIGALAGCGTLGLLITFMMVFRFSGMGGAPLAELATALCVYASMAMLFIWAGVDSIRCRRWVRPVVISVGWLTIVSMLFGIAFTVASIADRAVLFGDAGNLEVAGAGPNTVAFATTMTTTSSDTTVTYFVMLGTITLILVIAAVYTWFYSTVAVRRTLEAYDPTPSWTERCPVQVFVACTGLLMFGFSTAATAAQAAVPFFGIYLEGVSAVLVDLGAAVVMLTAMVLMYRTSMRGWWLAVTVIALGFASSIITLCRLGTMAFYRHGHATAEELERLGRASVMNGVTPVIFVVMGAVVCVGSLVWVRRYFRVGRVSEPL